MRYWASGRFGGSGRQRLYQSSEDDHVISSGAALCFAALCPAPKQSYCAKLHYQTLKETLAQSQVSCPILQDSLDVSQDMLSSAGGEYQHAAASDLEALQEVCPCSTPRACTQSLCSSHVLWEGKVNRKVPF